ncbi:uncharacterized protein [Lepeophtheirus salmonis]|uniref:uncharacterized protein n=1 Tax=Lepeophtheirus salmonis TaxID=72036 RepID=UPI001AE2AD74|nr:uncharacterized protein LOC121117114 [Lepeophtheirus salmonis]
MTVVKKDEEKGGKKFRSGSVKSWPPKSAWHAPVNKQNKRRFIFDHLWGIPGGMHKQDLLLLRNIHRTHEARKNRESYNPYIILDEQDIVENRDNCCNHSFGRTAREFSWHTNLHGFKYLTYCREHLFERILWGLICVIAIILGIFFSARAADFYYRSPRVLTVIDERGSVEGDFPSITFCPSTYSASKKRKEVSSRIPLMSVLWKNWDDVFSMNYNPLDSKTRNPLWINESSLKVRQLLQRIMIEGALLSYPSCTETLRKCSVSGIEVECCASLRKEFNPQGPCFSIDLSQRDSKRKELKRPKFTELGEVFTKARKELDISLRLSGTSSKRVGYPIVNVSYWKESYLCGDSWGRTEASVMCKSLGFSGGQKYFMSVGPAFPATNILGKLSCKGQEDSLQDCSTSYEGWDGIDLTTCDRSYPIALLCDSGGLQLGSNSWLRTRGKPYLLDNNSERSYFCAEYFKDEEANVFL